MCIFRAAGKRDAIQYVVIALVSNAGVMYAAIMPAVVTTVTTVMGLTEQQAGMVVSANVFSAVAGGVVATMLIRRMRWKRVTGCLLPLFILLDIASGYAAAFDTLIAARIVSGLLAGFIATSTAGVMARLNQPDRAAGVNFAFTLLLAGVGVSLAPTLTGLYGPAGLFSALAVLSIAALTLLPLARNFEPVVAHRDVRASVVDQRSTIIIGLVLSSVFLLQLANYGIFAFQQQIGLGAELDLGWVSMAVAAGLWISIPTSFFVVVVGDRFGRFIPISVAGMMMLLGVGLLHWSHDALIYLGAGLLAAMAMSLLVPFMFGVIASLDRSGQAASAAAIATKLGTAAGPLLAIVVLEYGTYSLLISQSVFVIAVSIAMILFAIHRARMFQT